MDEFQYQMLLNKVNSLKGTKQPLKDFIKELKEKFDPDSSYSLEPDVMAKLLYLTTLAINYSSSKAPVTYHIEKWIDSIVLRVVSHKDLSIEEKQNALEFYSKSLYVSATNIKELLMYNDMLKIIKDKDIIVSFYNLTEFKSLTNTDTAVYLYLSKVDPESPILSQIYDHRKTPQAIEKTEKEMLNLKEHLSKIV